MKQSKLRRSLLLPAVATLAVACGGGGGGGANVQPTTTLRGTLRMPQVAPSMAGFDVDQPMVPGEVVVWLAPGHDASEMVDDKFDLVRGGATGRMAVFHARAAEGRSSCRDGARIEDSVEKATCDAAEQMKRRQGVVCASPNYIMQATIEPSDSFYQAQWHYAQVNMPQTWALQQGSSDVIVAVLDTGIVSAR